MAIQWNRKDKVGGDGYLRGTCLTTDTKPTVSGPAILIDETGAEFKWTGTQWIQIASAGASKSVQAYEYAVSSDREMGAISSQTSDTWAEAEDVTKITIAAIGTIGESCVVCFDAPDTATATNWLSGNTTAGEPTLRKVIEVGVPREFNFKYPLRRIDAIDFVGTVTNLFIEAGK